MKKILALTVAALLVVALLAGCGGGEVTGHEGKYLSVAGEMMGISMTGEDMEGWEIELKAGGKGKMMVDGTSAGIKWSLDGSDITIKVQGEEMKGTLENDVIVIDDVLGMGMKITFAKEGSEAASDPSLGLSEDEKKVVGEWKSDAVTDVSDEDASGEIDPGALTMNLKADKTAEITYKGEDMGELNWSFALGTGSIEDFDLTFEISDDGSMEATYFQGDDYYNFHLVK